MNRRRIFDSFRQALEPRQDATQWLPLAAAARIVHAAERDTDRDRISRGLGETEDSLLAFWAHRVAELGVPVHGIPISALKHELIPATVVLGGRISDGATRLAIVHGQPITDFGALQVKRDDLDRALARSGSGTPRPT